MKGYSKRREGTKPQRKTVIIVCEGGTEKLYFESFRTRYRYAGLVIIPVENKKNDPKHIVEYAIKKMKENDLDYTTGDRSWCVFDVDESSDTVLLDAFQNAAREKVLIALSNPCIELWYILHFANQTGALTQKQAKRDMKRYIPGYKENLDISEELVPGETLAVRRAKGLNKQHERAGYCKNTRQFNPSSQLFELLEYFEKIAKEK